MTRIYVGKSLFIPVYLYIVKCSVG